MAETPADARTLVTAPGPGSSLTNPKSPLDRLLSLFGEVRAGEGSGVVLMAVNVFLLLAGYNLMKPARDALAITEAGSVGTAYSAAGQAVVLMGVIPLYGWLASRVPRMRFILVTCLFFASNLVLFSLAGSAGLHVGIAFYIWIGVYSVFTISQFWAFANDLYTEPEGRRLFPLIAVGASLGAWIGAASVAPLVRRLGYTPYTLMLIGAAVLLLSLGITMFVNRRETSRGGVQSAKTNEEPLGKEGGFAMVLKDNYLFWIAVLIVLLNAVNTTGGFLLNRLVEARAIEQFGMVEADRRQWTAAFQGEFFGRVNLIGFLIQLFLTSRIFKYIGVRGALFILPTIALINYSLIVALPVLAIVRFSKTLENATDYSIQNTVRHALFLPTSREAKYKAKAAVDTFFTRLGDLGQAGIVFVGTTVGMATSGFAMINVILTVVWLGVAVRIAKEHRKKTA